jgi:hypothetical protein
MTEEIADAPIDHLGPHWNSVPTMLEYPMRISGDQAAVKRTGFPRGVDGRLWATHNDGWAPPVVASEDRNSIS